MEKSSTTKESSTTKAPEKSRLGRGLSALIPPTPRPAATERQAAAPPAAAPEAVQEIPLASIATNPNQPRTEFNEAALAELTDSVRQHGILQPVMVRPRGGGRYELVAGERRYRAAERAGLTRIPVVVRDLTDNESLTVALIENIQREDLNPLEAAQAYKQLMDEYRLTQIEMARQIGKSQSTISNALRLLELPEPVLTHIKNGDLTAEHGRLLHLVKNPRTQQRLADVAVEQKLSVKQLEARVDAARRDSNEQRPAAIEKTKRDSLHWSALTEHFRSALGLQVAIKPKGKGGTLMVQFASPDEIEHVLERLRQTAPY